MKSIAQIFFISIYCFLFHICLLLNNSNAQNKVIEKQKVETEITGAFILTDSIAQTEVTATQSSVENNNVDPVALEEIRVMKKNNFERDYNVAKEKLNIIEIELTRIELTLKEISSLKVSEELMIMKTKDQLLKQEEILQKKELLIKRIELLESENK